MRIPTIAIAISIAGVTLQAQGATHVVTGIAYDSVAGAALSGAVVQAVLVGTAKDVPSRTFSAVADAAGHYRLTGLPSGRFAIGFQHRALTAFGIDAPIGGLELDKDTSVVFHLALTTSMVLAERPCLGVTSALDALLVGYVSAARADMPAVGARVTAEWVEMGLDDGKLRSQPHKLTATAGDDGSYKLCGLPPSTNVGFTVSRPGFRSLETELSIPEDGVARRDIALADSGVTHGSATIAAKLVQDDGLAIEGGQAIIRELHVEVPIRNGGFTIADLPAGSWSVLIRSIGYEEKLLIVDAKEHATASLAVRMERKVQTLEAIDVIGKASYDVKLLSDIQARQRVGGGTAILPGSDFINHAGRAADVVKGARGFRQRSEWRVEGRPYTINGHIAACGTVAKDYVPRTGSPGTTDPSVTVLRGAEVTTTRTEEKYIAIYLDGMRYNGGLQMLNDDLQPKQILAVEAYPDMLATPVQWRTNDACGVIVYWTKH